jgi:hypothetical protein
VGMQVLGQFRDLDDPNSFVCAWLSRHARAKACSRSVLRRPGLE